MPKVLWKHKEELFKLDWENWEQYLGKYILRLVHEELVHKYLLNE